MKKFQFLSTVAMIGMFAFGAAAQMSNENPKQTGIGEEMTPTASDASKTTHQAIHGKTSAATNNFVKGATIGNEFEIETSKLALDRSKDANVREFAQHMIDDHGKAQDGLKAALPTDVDQKLAVSELDARHQQVFDHLKQTSASNFNAAYIKAQKDAHAEAIGLFKSYAAHGGEKDLRDFAKATLPTVEDHMKHVNELHATKDAM